MGLLARLRRAPVVEVSQVVRAAPPVHYTWLQAPAFQSTGFRVKVVGESNYQHVLEWASGGRTEDGAAQPLVTAQLVREPSNPYDHNAVRVDLGGQTAAYVAREQAVAFHAPLAALAATGMPATCRAWLTGGWDRGALDKGYFGLELDVHPNLELNRDRVVLPFGDGRVSITGEEAAQPLLEALLAGADRQEVVAVLSLDGDRLAVTPVGVDDRVGHLTPKMSQRYRSIVEDAVTHGFEPTCHARVIRGPKKIEFFLKIGLPST